MELYQRYGPAVRRKCERILGNTEDAEDVMQSLFIDIINKQINDVDLPYLFRAATNRCLNLIRDRKKRTRLLILQSKAERDVFQDRAPLQSLIHRELLQRLSSGFDRKCSEIFIYYYLDNMSQEEIAALMHLSRKSIGKKLNKIRQIARGLNREDMR